MSLPITRGELSAARVRGLWEHLSRHFGSRTSAKAASWRMRAAARALQLAGVLPAAEFMERFTTVIGRRIFTPFEVGVASAAHPLWAQVVVGVHEHQHIVQHAREGYLRMAPRYLLSARARAAYEAEAYTCNLELQWLRSGQMPDPTELAGRLAKYGCGPEAIAVAAEILARNAERVRRGQIVTEATAVAVQWRG